MNPSDFVITGNFNVTNDGEEVIFINPYSKWFSLKKHSGDLWSNLYSSNSGEINGWIIRNDDIYLSGDIDGDDLSELICLNRGSKWASIYKFSNSNWNLLWTNNGNTNVGLGGWLAYSETSFLFYDFNKDNKEEILFVNKVDGWSTMKQFNNQPYWNDLFCNYGNGWIGSWHIDYFDNFLYNNFSSAENEKYLLGVNKESGYSNIQKYNNPPENINCDRNLLNNNSISILPNPFNINVKIKYINSESEYTSVKIYDLSGRLVKTIINKYLPPNEYEFNWNSTNEKGEIVSSGIYFLKINSKTKNLTEKLILSK